VGIGDEWLGNAEDPDHWRESHFEFQGPVVAQMQGGFIDHWVQAYQEVPQGAGFFPRLDAVGNTPAQAFNSRGGGGDTVRTLFLLAIAAAQEKIYIGTPYFVPDDFLLETLLDARARG